MSEVNTDNELVGTLSGASTLEGTLTIPERLTIQANKNITPTDSQQVIGPDTGYDAMAQVTVGAIRLENKTVTPSDAVQTISAGENYDGLGVVTVEAASGGTDTLDALMNDGTNAQTVNMTDDNANHACYGVKGGINVVLPNTVTTIEASAFDGCNFLKSISAPGVTEIKDLAFRACYSLSSMEFPNVHTVGDNAFANISNGESDRYIRFPVLSKIKGGAFYGSYKISDIYIGYNGVCVLDSTSAFNRSLGGFTVHVPSDQLASYQADATWADAVANRGLTLVGDYE